MVAAVLPGQTCVLEARTNLLQDAWTALSTNTAQAGGALTLTAAAAATSQERFYRLRYQ